MTKKKSDELEQQNAELVMDLQRVRADFENYRKRIDQEKEAIRDVARASTVLRILPIIDDIERAIMHAPKEIADNNWVKGIKSLEKKLITNLGDLGVTRIASKPGSEFNPELHEAVMFDEDSEGDKEVISEELRTGYKLGDEVIRPTMVKVTKK
jgi:Molecular chaperone GrpE (heat shock protein)